MIEGFEEIKFFVFDKGAQNLFEIMRELEPLLDENNELKDTEKELKLSVVRDLVFVASKQLDIMDTVSQEYGGLVLFMQSLGGDIAYRNKEKEHLKEKFMETGEKVIDLGKKIQGKKLEGF